MEVQQMQMAPSFGSLNELTHDKIRRDVKQRRLRLHEFFKTFDMHRTKKITRSCFRRALDTAGFNLEEKSLQALMEAYSVKEAGQEDLIAYQDLVDRVNDVFALKGLEQNPTMSTQRPMDIKEEKKYGVDHPSLTEDERKRLIPLLDEIKRSSSTLLIKHLFRDFDRNNDGNVTEEQFLRVIGNYALIDEAKILRPDLYGDILVKAYRSSDEFINYRALHHDMTSVPTPRSNTDAPCFLETRTHSSETRLPTLQKHMAMECITRSLKPHDHFRLLDALGIPAGQCSKESFYRSLRQFFRFTIANEDIEALVALYPVNDQPTRVMWSKFVTELEASVLQVLLEQKSQPLHTRVSAQLTTKEQELVNEVVYTLREKISHERILLRATFENFDPRHEQCVSKEQFIRVLDSFDLLPSDIKLQELLAKKYEAADFRHFPSELQAFVDYHTFLHDVDPDTAAGHDEQTATVEGPRCLHEPVRLQQDRSYEAIIHDLRSHCLSHRSTIDFSDYNRLGHGTCTVSQFQRVLKQAGHLFTETELKDLCARFPAPEAAGESGLVSHRDFLAEVTSVFTVSELEKSDSRLDVRHTLRAARGTEAELRGERPGEMDVGKLTPEEEKRLGKYLRELAMQVNMKRLNVPRLFKDYDRMRHGLVEEHQLERALGQLMLPPADVLKLICLKFRESSRGIYPAHQVNYLAFCRAVELANDPLKTPRGVQGPLEMRAMLKESKSAPALSLPSIKGASPRGEDEVNESEPLQKVIESIASQISHMHCKFGDFFHAEDSLSTGEVNATKLKHCLVLAKVSLTSTEIEVLKRNFKGERFSDCVSWRELVAAVEKVQLLTSTGCSKRLEEMDWQTEELILKLRSTIMRLNPNLTQFFNEYDRSHSGKVTESQFFAAIDMLAPATHITEPKRGILSNVFVKDGIADYAKFIKIMDAEAY